MPEALALRGEAHAAPGPKRLPGIELRSEDQGVSDARAFAEAFQVMGQRIEVLNNNLGVLGASVAQLNASVVQLVEVLRHQGNAGTALRSAADLAQALQGLRR